MKFRAGYATVELQGMLEDDQAKEIFAHFGLAIHVANILEHSIVNALFVLELGSIIREFKSREEWESAYDKFFADGFAQTYGNLLKRVEKSAFLSLDLMESLKHTKTVRDHLVHGFQRETAEHFYSQKGRKLIIEECSHAIQLFDVVDAQVEAEMAIIRPKLGINEEVLAARTEAAMLKLLEDANNEEAG